MVGFRYAPRLAVLGCSILLSVTAMAADLGSAVGSWDLRVMGGRRGPELGLLKIQQGGAATLAGKKIDAKIDGDNISFTFERQSFFGGSTELNFKGEVDGNDMKGETSSKGRDGKERTSKWTATRVGVNPAPLDFSGVWETAGSLAAGGWQPSKPGLTPAGEARAKRFTQWDDVALRCQSVGLGKLFSWPYLTEIVTAKDRPLIVILYEGEREVRRIHLDGRDFPPEDGSFTGAMGYSVGHIDGRTLTVTTKDLTPAQLQSANFRLHQMGKETTILEHYTLTDDGQYIRADLTVTDPLTLKQPITKHIVLTRTDDQVAPYSCDPYSFFRQLLREGKYKAYFDYDPVFGKDH